MTILYLVFLALLIVFIGCSWRIHAKRTGNWHVDSYRWFVKLLK